MPDIYSFDVLSTLNLIGITVAIFVYIYKSIRDNNSKYDNTTIKKFEDAIKARDLEITSLQKQVTVLQSQVNNLENSNSSLQNMVTGKDVLIRMEKNIDRFIPFLEKDGIIETFLTDNQLIIKQLKAINDLLTNNFKKGNNV